MSCFIGRLVSTCALSVPNSATLSLCDILLPKTEKQAAKASCPQELWKVSAAGKKENTQNRMCAQNESLQLHQISRSPAES